MPAMNVTKETILRYRDERLLQGAARATINSEMAALKTAFYRAADKLPSLPVFPAQLKENNTRTGFDEEADYERRAANASELWLRLYLELGFTYGWRKGELLNLRVRHVNLENRKIRLDPGTTKNDEGREVLMMAKVAELLRLAVAAKRGDDFVLTRDAQRGKPAAPVRDFRAAWRNLSIQGGPRQIRVPELRARLGEQEVRPVRSESQMDRTDPARSAPLCSEGTPRGRCRRVRRNGYRRLEDASDV